MKHWPVCRRLGTQCSELKWFVCDLTGAGTFLSRPTNTRHIVQRLNGGSITILWPNYHQEIRLTLRVSTWNINLLLYDNYRQIYLLTPMDRATRPNAKSTMSFCTLSVITVQQALLHRPTTMSVISTYTHGKTQTPVGQFVVDMLGLYKQDCINCSNKSNRWTMNFSVLHHWRLPSYIWEQQRSTIDGIVALT